MHDPDYFRPCPKNFVCHCLQITEAMLIEALTTADLKTIKDIRRFTGAGDGCNACHRVLTRYLEMHHHAHASDEPICSVK